MNTHLSSFLLTAVFHSGNTNVPCRLSNRCTTLRVNYSSVWLLSIFQNINLLDILTKMDEWCCITVNGHRTHIALITLYHCHVGPLSCSILNWIVSQDPILAKLTLSQRNVFGNRRCKSTVFSSIQFMIAIFNLLTYYLKMQCFCIYFAPTPQILMAQTVVYPPAMSSCCYTQCCSCS